MAPLQGIASLPGTQQAKTARCSMVDDIPGRTGNIANWPLVGAAPNASISAPEQLGLTGGQLGQISGAEAPTSAIYAAATAERVRIAAHSQRRKE
jgi:hypothetical protein